MIWHPNVLAIGEPGSGKSVGAARDAIGFPGAAVVQDPHKESFGQLVLTYGHGDMLVDRLSDLEHTLGYELLKPSRLPDPNRRMQQNLLRAQTFVEFLMRRRGGDAATSPLLEEWAIALLLLFLYQEGPAKGPEIIPYAFMPDTPQFEALLRDCSLEQTRHKFEGLKNLANPRALRAEVGSTERFINPVFRAPEFLKRCRGGFDLGAFLQRSGKLIVERGEASEDVCRILMGGLNMLVTEHCEQRQAPFPPVRIYLDECTNARTAGQFEERKAGETRKNGLSWYFLCQWPNFPGGPDGYYQNCSRKEAYRTGFYDLARKLASMAAPGYPSLNGETHAAKVTRLAEMITQFQPGQRLVTDRGGSRVERVEMLEDRWRWPGLLEAKMKEKLQCIYRRIEYRAAEEPRWPTTSPPASPPPDRSRDAGSPAERLKRRARRRADGSKNSDDEGAST